MYAIVFTKGNIYFLNVRGYRANDDFFFNFIKYFLRN